MRLEDQYPLGTILSCKFDLGLYIDVMGVVVDYPVAGRGNFLTEFVRIELIGSSKNENITHVNVTEDNIRKGKVYYMPDINQLREL